MTAPVITATECIDDAGWFRGTRRRYRLRRTTDGGGGLIRRRAGVLLRCLAPSLPSALPDNDEAIRPYWFLAAWPDLPAAQRAELIREARKIER